MTFYLYHDTASNMAALTELPVIPELYPTYRFVDSFEEAPDMQNKAFNSEGELVEFKTPDQINDELVRAMPSLQEQLDAIWAELPPAKTPEGRAIRQRIADARAQHKPAPKTGVLRAAKTPLRAAKPMPRPIVQDAPPAMPFNPEPPPPNDPPPPSKERPRHSITDQIIGDNRRLVAPYLQPPQSDTMARNKEQGDEQNPAGL